MGLKKTFLTSIVTGYVMEVIKKFNPDRPIGSIKKKEVKNIIKEMMEQFDDDKIEGMF